MVEVCRRKKPEIWMGDPRVLTIKGSRKSVLFLFLILAVNLVLPASHALADKPVLIDSPGIWTLERLGYSDIVFPCKENWEEFSVHYLLPEGASQGTDGWYIVHLNFQIEFSEDSECGVCYVQASCNDSAGMMVELVTRRTVYGSLIVSWSTLDLINGYMSYSTSSLLVEITSSNYITYDGVKPGLNTLTFSLQVLEGSRTRVKSLRILSTSGIEYTRTSPPKLSLKVDLPKHRIAVGDVFTIPFELTNVGYLPAADVELKVIYPDDMLMLRGDKSYSVALLDSEQSVKGLFEFKAMKAGSAEVVVAVTRVRGGSNRPWSRINIPIQAKMFSARTLAIVICAGLLISLVLVQLVRSHKKASG